MAEIWNETCYSWRVINYYMASSTGRVPEGNEWNVKIPITQSKKHILPQKSKHETKQYNSIELNIKKKRKLKMEYLMNRENIRNLLIKKFYSL